VIAGKLHQLLRVHYVLFTESSGLRGDAPYVIIAGLAIGGGATNSRDLPMWLTFSWMTFSRDFAIHHIWCRPGWNASPDNALHDSISNE
jgi:hypothetical protein